MALKNVAAVGMTLSIVQGTPTPVFGTIIITGPPSTKGRAEGNFIYQDQLAIQVVNITSPPATIPDPGPKSANINAAALKNELETKLVLRKDDLTGIINATPQVPGSPPVAYPVTFKVQITVAGPTKVKAE